MSGLQPHIDPISTFDNFPPKRTRYSPPFGNGSAVPLHDAKPFTPGQSAPYVSSPSYVQNGHPPQSPLNLGGLMSTPAQTPNMGGLSAQGLNVPQSPYGMMNGMSGIMGVSGFGMGPFPFNINMVRIWSESEIRLTLPSKPIQALPLCLHP